jgi:hypothetical protein
MCNLIVSNQRPKSLGLYEYVTTGIDIKTCSTATRLVQYVFYQNSQQYYRNWFIREDVMGPVGLNRIS